VSDAERRQRIVASVPIVEVVGACLRLHPGGGKFRSLCPFHDDLQFGFEVDPEVGRYRCRGCGAEGDVVDFVREFELVADSEALAMLEEKRPP
jgi:DNA primase